MIVMAMVPVIVTPGIVMIAMGRTIGTGISPIPMMPMVTTIPIAIRIADRHVTEIDRNASSRNRAANDDGRASQSNERQFRF